MPITRLARGLASGSALEFANKEMLADASQRPTTILRPPLLATLHDRRVNISLNWDNTIPAGACQRAADIGIIFAQGPNVLLRTSASRVVMDR